MLASIIIIVIQLVMVQFRLGMYWVNLYSVTHLVDAWSKLMSRVISGSVY